MLHFTFFWMKKEIASKSCYNKFVDLKMYSGGTTNMAKTIFYFS
ncbi:hypothetical protein NT05LI_1953 [Listeria ivanovii FSL F6-596]|nr:hypothetical protein NT05LI_1953 [Listeria ivanovii FSL F6-596]